jgi:hypothetical protein
VSIYRLSFRHEGLAKSKPTVRLSARGVWIFPKYFFHLSFDRDLRRQCEDVYRIGRAFQGFWMDGWMDRPAPGVSKDTYLAFGFASCHFVRPYFFPIYIPDRIRCLGFFSVGGVVAFSFFFFFPFFFFFRVVFVALGRAVFLIASDRILNGMLLIHLSAFA